MQTVKKTQKMDLKSLCTKVCDIAKNTGMYIREQNQLFTKDDIQTKQKHDFVTYVDKTAEKKIIAGLKEILPSAGFISEEDNSLPVAEKWNWIIDPVDGTTNFIHKIPVYSVSIALKEKDEVVLGVVYEINRDECFYAWKASKAYCNAQEIQVSGCKTMDNAILATGFPFRDLSLLEPYMQMLEKLMRNTRGLRRLGSAAVDLSYVACGRFDGFFEYGLSPWDVAAGAFIVQQAGGKVMDFNGKYDYLFEKQILAGNPDIASQLNVYTKAFFGSF